MNIERRVIGIARHGFTPNDTHGLSLDSLTDQSVQNMYTQGLTFGTTVGEGVQTDKAFVLHSDKNRTLTTAKARLAGIRGLAPVPANEADLHGFAFNGTLFIRDDRLSYENLQLNDDVVRKIGLPKYAEWMVANRHATEMEGKQVTSFQQIYDTRKPILGDAVRRLEAGRYGVGLISTHATIADAITMAAIDSGRNTPITRYDEMGGQFDKEGVAYLVIDTHTKSGNSDARLIRGELNLPANIDRIRSEY